MTRWIQSCSVAAVLFCGLVCPATGRADAVDDILKFLATAGVVDSAIVDAKPLIECLVKSSSPDQCINVQEALADQAGNLKDETTSQAEKTAAQFLPSDPAIKTVVAIIQAASASDWLRVLELTGVDLLAQIACKAGLTWGGPLNKFICGEWAPKVMSLAEPVVHELLSILKTWPDINLWKLVSVMGFDFACEVTPDIPLKNEVCGLLGEAVKALASLGKAALDALGDGLEALSDLLGGGGSSKQSIETYYAYGVRPLIYKRALERLTVNRQDLGLDKQELDQCIAYYGTTGGAKCVGLDPKLRQEAEAMVKLAQALPQGYLERWLTKEAQDYALVRPGVGQAYRNFINKLAPADWDTLVDSTGASVLDAHLGLGDADVAYFKTLFTNCRFRVNETLMGTQGYGTPIFAGLAPQSLTNWVCYQTAGKLFAEALVKETARLETEVTPALAAAGCARNPGFPLSFTCANHVGFGACLARSRQDYGENRYCKLDIEPAAGALARSLVDVLGEKRCQYIPNTKGNFGDWDPRVHCTRPWKEDSCKVLMATFLAKHGVPGNRVEMRCSYHADASFTANRQRAREIVAALNSAPTRSAAAATRRCALGWDPVTFTCQDQKTPPQLPEQFAGVPLKACPEDPGKHGADEVCYRTMITAADSMAALAEKPLVQAEAPGMQPPGCDIELTYLEPQPPEIDASVPSLGPGDQFRIQCHFKRRTRQLRLETCDDASRQLATRLQRHVPAGRSSGIIVIDEARVAVATAPADGGDFSRQQLWSHKETGAFTAACEIDNPLAYHLADAPARLSAAVTYEVSARRQPGRATRFDPASARGVPARALSEELIFAPGLEAR